MKGSPFESGAAWPHRFEPTPRCRTPGQTQPFQRVQDKVRQHYLTEKTSQYIQALEQKYAIAWHVLEQPEADGK